MPADPDATLPPADGTPTAAHTSGDVGQVVAGRYKLLERIGEGGMGTVWMAEQRQPVKRLVAVKLIKPGLDTRAVLARFEAERQALAIMDHPHIARVLDAGETEDSRPFFVMELVRGVPITRFADDARLTTRQRLELFVPVCQAIQHAHTKGVIHRDIKPGNVLVALYDGVPVPKVIDFGIAKAAGQPLTDKTLHTTFGAVVGTPEYMSPEQASFNQLDVDTRSDVYSLGVLLYELLTGGPPFTRKGLAAAGLLEMLRVVREQEPPRPSTRLSSAGTLPALAATRGTEPAKLPGLLRGEVDWIVMKALEKDRGRRYEAATGFAADVRRHLDGEPVQAVPPSAGYRLRKFVRRHRGRVLVSATVLLALVAGLAGTGWQAVRASRAERLARAAEAEAVEQKRAAERAAAFALVDLDLFTQRSEERTGLLRLAGRYAALPADLTDLQLFTLTDVLAVGQQFAPLLAPHPAAEAKTAVGDDDSLKQFARYQWTLSPDGRAVLALDEDGVPGLWDVLAAGGTPLPWGGGRLDDLRWTPDGRTCYARTTSGEVTVWDPASARMRCVLNRRQGLRHGEEGLLPCQASNARLVTCDELSEHWGGELDTGRTSARLWDITTGRLIARLDDGSGRLSGWQLHADQWLTAQESDKAVRVHDAATGQLVARLRLDSDRLPSGGGSVASWACAEAAGNWLVVVTYHDGGFSSGPSLIRWWDTRNWRSTDPPTHLSESPASWSPWLVSNHTLVATGHSYREFRLARAGVPSPKLIPMTSYGFDPVTLPGNQLIGPDGRVYDLATGRPRNLPAGRRFHPELQRVAVNGWVACGGPFGELRGRELVDLRTERAVPIGGDELGWSHLAGLGFVSLMKRGDIRLIPTSAPPIPPAALELWAKVAVRGELGPDGGFVPWDEPTWQRKWQQLAAVPPPDPNFPFPGHLARDPLHWLRKEFEAADGSEQLPLACELLRRAEGSGDAPEAARWRREVAKRVPEAAPPPRPAVR